MQRRIPRRSLGEPATPRRAQSSPRSLRRRAGSALVRPLIVALPVAAILAAFAQVASAAVPTHTFAYTGGAQSWTVPAGVTNVTVRVMGAGGGKSACSDAGGGGARVDATLAVVPGQVLNLTVGGSGADSTYEIGRAHV